MRRPLSVLVPGVLVPGVLVPGLLVLGLVVGGCSGGSRDADDPADPGNPASSSASAAASDTIEYVALGDSYAAAPGVPTTSGEDGCFRSDHNYAHQLAATDAAVVLTDATCSGATSNDVLARQVPELDEETDLVTLGIGGNDFDLFTRLISQCAGFGSAAPGRPCTTALRTEVDDALPRIETNVAAVLDAVAEAAPDARVVLVGYPRLLPTRGTCPDLVPLPAGDQPFLNDVTDGLSDALRTQARARGLDFVDVARASRGHDICSARPWVNGAVIAPDGTIPFHPFLAEQRAVAGLIAELL